MEYSEEEKKAIEYVKAQRGIYYKTVINVIKKQQKEIENIKRCAEWHISNLTETIKDYIDDDRKGNADIIADFKEQREHWKDIIKITKNEKTYIDYNEG